MSVESFRVEVESKERFEFGKNWIDFLEKIDKERIHLAEKSLCSMLGEEQLRDKTFLDIGSGSGLFSLAAHNRGADVTSFDFDESSVWCTCELKKRFTPDAKNWSVHQGSVLDNTFLSQLGQFDIVYSWGVLHHTGQMWAAIDNSARLVKKRGTYFIAIYNDEGVKSRIWWIIKYIYNRLPVVLRKLFAYSLNAVVFSLVLLKYTLKLKPMTILAPLLNSSVKRPRGMSTQNDMLDWYGGLPFEFANYDALITYVENKGFEFQHGNRATSIGCHELIFRKRE